MKIPCGSPLAGEPLFLEPWNGDADCKTPEHSQDVGGLWLADATAILVEHFIKPVVERAFDAPIVAFYRLQVLRRESFQWATADQMHRLDAHLAMAAHSSPQLGDLRGRWKAERFGSRLLAFDHADFRATAVTLPLAGAGPRRGRRGEKRGFSSSVAMV